MARGLLLCKGQIPISTAVEISATDDKNAQLALLSAYESKKLRGRALINVRRLIEQRRIKGKSLRGGIKRIAKTSISSTTLVRTYQQEVERQKLLVKKAKLCESRLRDLCITSGKSTRRLRLHS